MTTSSHKMTEEDRDNFNIAVYCAIAGEAHRRTTPNYKMCEPNNGQKKEIDV